MLLGRRAWLHGAVGTGYAEPVRKIEAILDPDQLDPVKEALGLIGARGMTVCEVTEAGAEPGRASLYRGTRYAFRRSKIRLEIVVDDGLADAVVRRLIVTANRDRASDGTIVVLPICDVIRIRTGERGPGAV
jgi:nitrogen regulatory protein P-II 1